MSPLKAFLILHRQQFVNDRQLYSQIIDLATHYGSEPMMAWVPSEHLEGFGSFIRSLFPIENLIHIPSGPLSEHRKQTLRSIRDWFNQRDEAARSASPVLAASTDS